MNAEGQQPDMAREAMQYAAMGWQLVPLHTPVPGPKGTGCSCGRDECENAGKHPRIKAWQHNASCDEEQVVAWWSKWPAANIGVKLGKDSGIIDIEADDAEQEATFLQLFGGQAPVTACYQSANGKHWLFKWNDGLPAKAVSHFGHLGIRIGNAARGSQSVLPPSMHMSGVRYTWICHPSEVPPAELPPVVIAKIFNADGSVHDTEIVRPRSARMNLYDKDFVPEGERDNTLYAEACEQWRLAVVDKGPRSLDDPEMQSVVFVRVASYNVARCRPPLERDTIVQKVESARAFIRQKLSTDEHSGGMALVAIGLEIKDDEWYPGVWKVQTINSDPKIMRIIAPFLKEPMDLLTEEFDSPTAVHRAILSATGNVCVDDGVFPWKAVWNGFSKKVGGDVIRVRGLKAKLLDESEAIEAPAEVRRESIVASFLTSALENARVVEEGKESSGCKCFRRDNGMIWFSFSAIMEDASYSADGITRIELSKLVRSLGVRDKDLILPNGKKRNMMVLNPSGEQRLLEIASCGGVADKNREPL